MTVIRGDDDQRVFGTGHLERCSDRHIKRIRVRQRARCVDAVVRVINPTALDHQDKTILIARQASDRGLRQLCQ